jgi:hypothetical protein
MIIGFEGGDSGLIQYIILLLDGWAEETTYISVRIVNNEARIQAERLSNTVIVWSILNVLLQPPVDHHFVFIIVPSSRQKFKCTFMDAPI